MALLGGIYEDVSAITRGWKSNPVGFDSVFNRSTSAYLLGSPDIVPMFSDALVGQGHRVHARTYDAEFEDFAGDPALLDSWVVEEWTQHVVGHAEAGVPGAIHFLHLLGVDTSGHAFRPASAKYKAMAEHVDALVQRVYERMEQAFPDGRTAYVFTSDHGMSAKGSHGAGDPTETETPLVLWGAGVRGPLPSRPATDRPTPRAWALDHLLRRDIEQADVAPLLAALMGVAIPVNSVGALPVDFLDVSEQEAAALVVWNAEQMLRQLEVKQARAQSHSLLSVVPDYVALPAGLLETAKGLLARGKLQEARSEASQSLQASRAHLDLLDRRDSNYLKALMLCGFVGWMLNVWLWLMGRGQVDASVQRTLRVVQVGGGTLWVVVLLLERAPLMYYVYAAGALIFCTEAVARLWCARGAWLSLLAPVRQDAVMLVAALGALEAMVAGFYWKPMYAVILAAFGFLFGVLKGGFALGASLAVLSVFPLVEHHSDATWMVLVAMLCCLGVAITAFHGTRRVYHVVGLGAAAVVISWSAWRHEEQLLLHPVAQALAWALLAVNVAALGWRPYSRVHVLLCLAAMYALFSLGFEALFVVCFGWALHAWVEFERAHSNDASAGLRRAVVYLLLTYAAFFGTGNEGSLSSFEIRSTYRFVTVFNPFLMGALLVAKVAILFVMVGAAYGEINSGKQGAPLVSDAFFSVLLLSDVMALNFFLMVRNEGSWRDIGVSISHFGMSNAHVLFQLIMFRLPRWLGI